MFDPTSEQQATISRIQNVDYSLEGRFRLWNQERLYNYNQISGRIYRNEDLNKLIKEKRPSFQYNLYAPVLMQILGDFLNSVPTLELRPRGLESEKSADLFETLNDWVLHTKPNDIDYTLSRAFLDALVGRIGWIRQQYNYTDEFPDGNIQIQHCDPFTIKFDPEWKRRDMKDCNFIDEFRMLSTEEIIQIYAADDPDLADKINESSRDILGDSTSSKQMLKTWAERTLNYMTHYPGEYAPAEQEDSQLSITQAFLNVKNGLFKVIDWYERRLTHKMMLIDTASGKERDITKMVRKSTVLDLGDREWYDNDKLQALREASPNSKVDEALVSKVFQTSTIPIMNAVLRDEEQDIANGNFRFTPILCYDWHPDLMFTRSMVDNIKDAVLSFNQRRNTVLTILQKNSAGGWIYEESAIRDHEEVWKANVVGQNLPVRDGFLGKVQAKESVPWPEGIDKYAAEDSELVKLMTGSTDNSRGLAQNAGEPASLFAQRVRQANLMQNWIADNAQAAVKMITENNIALIQHYFTDYRVIRLDKGEDYQWVELNKPMLDDILNDTMFGDYDVTVTPVPYGTQAREAEYMKLLNFAMMMGKIDPKLIPIKLLIENAPILHKKAYVDYINQQLQAAGQAPMGPGKQIPGATPAGQAEQLIAQNAQAAPQGPTAPGAATPQQSIINALSQAASPAGPGAPTQ